jgi:hypothetical protein
MRAVAAWGLADLEPSTSVFVARATIKATMASLIRTIVAVTPSMIMVDSVIARSPLYEYILEIKDILLSKVISH